MQYELADPWAPDQEQLIGLYMQEIDRRLMRKEEHIAFGVLVRVGKHRIGELRTSIHSMRNSTDPIVRLAYEDWQRAVLAVRGARVWLESNSENNRAQMSDRAPKYGHVNEELQERLNSPDWRVRGTALGDVARGWT